MHGQHMTASALALLLSGPSLVRARPSSHRSGTGKVRIHNTCDFSVNMCEVGNDVSAQEDVAAGSTHTYATKPRTDRLSGVKAGYSIKMGRPDQGYGCQSPSGITQFEYNKDEAQGLLWYDISNVNCADTADCPFVESGISMDANCGGGGGCLNFGCAAGDDGCDEIYQVSDPGPNRHPVGAAPLEAVVDLYLCRPKE